MNKQENQPLRDTEKLKEIPKWTKRYAQNRTLTTVVIIAMGIIMGAVVTIPISCLITAFVKRNIILGIIGAVLFVIMSVFYVKFLLKFGGKNRGLIDRRIDKWIYGNEGIASVPNPKLTNKQKWLEFVIAAIVFICIIGSNSLCMDGYLSFKYLQPISVLFIVPFLVSQYFLRRPKQGPLLLICPVLYTVHAILIVASVPIFFMGGLGILNMALPLFGYTFLVYAIGHFYSRYALQQLKNIANLQENNNEC